MLEYFAEREGIRLSTCLTVMLFGHNVTQFIIRDQFFNSSVVVREKHLDSFMVLCIAIMYFLDDLGTHSLPILHIV